MPGAVVKVGCLVIIKRPDHGVLLRCKLVVIVVLVLENVDM